MGGEAGCDGGTPNEEGESGGKAVNNSGKQQPVEGAQFVEQNAIDCRVNHCHFYCSPRPKLYPMCTCLCCASLK